MSPAVLRESLLSLTLYRSTAPPRPPVRLAQQQLCAAQTRFVAATAKLCALRPSSRRHGGARHDATRSCSGHSSALLARKCSFGFALGACARPADCDPNRARPCHVCQCAHRRAGHLGRTNVHPSSSDSAGVRPTRQEAGLHYLGCLGCAVAVRLIRTAATSHLVAYLSGRRQVFAARPPPVSSCLSALTIRPRVLRRNSPDVFNLVTANTALVPK